MEANFYKILENELKTLKRRTKLFQILKRELTKQGYWRNLPRGDAKKGYFIAKSGKNNVF